MNETDLQTKLQEIAQNLFPQLAEVIEFTKASIQRIVGNKRILVGAFGFDKESLQSRLLRPVDTDPVVDEIVSQQKPKIIPYTNAAPNWEKQPGTSDVNSWIGWPLVFHGESVGLVTLDHDQPGFYANLSPTLMAKLDQLMTRTANAMGEVSILDAEKEKVEALKIHHRGLGVIVSIGKKILKAADSNAVLNEVVSGAIALTNSDSGVIFLLNADGTEVIDKFHPLGFEHPLPRLRNEDGTPNENSITRTVIRLRKPLSIADIQKDDRVNPALKREYRSMFAIPLVLDDFVMGVLYLNGKTSRALAETETSLLSALVEQAVLSIQIKNSEAMYHAIPQFVVLKDTQSRFRGGNKNFCRSLSRPGQELKEKDIIGKRDSDFYEAESVKEYVKNDQQVIKDKKALPFEELHKSPSIEKPMWVQGVKTPVFDAAGEVIGVQAIFWDITERKERERELAHERYLLRTLLDNIPDNIYFKDLESRFISVNKHLAKQFGLESPDDAAGMRDSDFFTPEHVHPAFQTEQDIINTEQGVYEQIEKETYLDGRERYVLTTKLPLKEVVTGQIIGTFGISRDIDKLVRALSKEALYHAIVDHAYDMIYTRDKGGRFLSLNRAGQKLTGYTEQEFQSLTLLDITALQYKESMSRVLTRKTKGNQNWRVEMLLLAKDGRPIDMEFSTCAVRRPKGQKPRTAVIVGIGRDVSERNKVRKELEAANKRLNEALSEKNALLREVHHRVKNNLEMVSSLLFLERGKLSNDMARDAFDKGRTQVLAMALVHRQLSRLGSNSEIDMRDYLAELLPNLLKAFGADRREIKGESDLDAFTLPHDVALPCCLIVHELVTNSLKHAFPDGRPGIIRLTCKCSSARRMKLTVADNGCGLPSSVDYYSTPTLGLSLVRRLALNELDGKLHLVKDGGTSFTVELSLETQTTN